MQVKLAQGLSRGGIRRMNFNGAEEFGFRDGVLSLSGIDPSKMDMGSRKQRFKLYRPLEEDDRFIVFFLFKPGEAQVRERFNRIRLVGQRELPLALRLGVIALEPLH